MQDILIVYDSKTGNTEKVAKALADLLLAEGSRPVEIIYQNLDMDDFYEYKGE